MVLESFIFFLLIFFSIGVASYWRSRGTQADYLLASRSISPALAGLSAVATNNSGFMFIGMIGATYSMGLSSIWLMIGWILGDFWAQRKAVSAIRVQAQKTDVHSVGNLLSLWVDPEHSRKLKWLIGLFTIIFLTIYAAAQLKAGTKATQVLLDWSPSTGILVAAVIIFVYSLVGGIRASIWTDVVQSLVMITGMLTLLIFGIAELGGITDTVHLLTNISPDYMALLPNQLNGIEIIFFLFGWVFGGMAVLGQPQILSRFLTLAPEADTSKMQLYYYSWFILFYGLTIGVGLVSRLLIPEAGQFDSELALPTLSESLLPSVMIGLILAALFAATMSTVDSIILACSASITQDFTHKPITHLMVSKVATMSILILAMFFALSNNQTVFSLVLDAWGLLGSAFAPLVLLLSFKRKLREKQAFGVILSGLAIFSLFNYSGWLSFIYAPFFGILSGLFLGFILSKKTS